MTIPLLGHTCRCRFHHQRLSLIMKVKLAWHRSWCLRWKCSCAPVILKYQQCCPRVHKKGRLAKYKRGMFHFFMSQNCLTATWEHAAQKPLHCIRRTNKQMLETDCCVSLGACKDVQLTQRKHKSTQPDCLYKNNTPGLTWTDGPSWCFYCLYIVQEFKFLWSSNVPNVASFVLLRCVKTLSAELVSCRKCCELLSILINNMKHMQHNQLQLGNICQALNSFSVCEYTYINTRRV